MIPKQLRDRVGLAPGEVEVTLDGAGLRIEPIALEALTEKSGRLVIQASGATIDDVIVQQLRDGDRR